MSPTPPTPTVLANPDFAFGAELHACIEAEQTYAAADLGPTDALPEEHRILEYVAFYGPLSPGGTPSPSPSPSRSASPAPRAGSASSSTPKPAPAIRSGNSKTRRNKQKSHQNRATERQNQRNERRADPYEIRTSTFVNHVIPAVPTCTPFDLKTIPVASTGFVALPDADGGDTCSADELVRYGGCKYIPWDGL